ncbi:hypothetical protein NBM05_07320 [Rothia sp. AR01]|uniref:Lipoprotein n=1 Tax=Rothia santali TaxID=2949643 RepID=A0A9X2HCM2_9MICC|nr:hypothetical protein [Rothia santali]MCP3425820.1 hypothetical protein [Rothia santali]
MMTTTKKMIVPVIGLAVLAITGCGSSEEEASEASPSPSEMQVADGHCMDVDAAHRDDPDSVGYTAASVMHCWDSTMDATMTDAALRAAPLMSEEWAAQQTQPERNAIQGQFSAAAKHEAYSVPEVSRTGGDVDQNVDYDKVARGFTIEWEWQGRDGETVPGGSAQIMVYMEMHSGKWEVVGHHTTTVQEEDR